jgi:hypothetical protein
MNERQRTIQQNKALHLYCEMWAKALNDAGLDMKKTLKPGIDIPWTMQSFKDNIWKVIQDATLKKDSTTEMNTTDPTLISDIINRHMSEKFGISIAWPDRTRLEVD